MGTSTVDNRFGVVTDPDCWVRTEEYGYQAILSMYAPLSLSNIVHAMYVYKEQWGVMLANSVGIARDMQPAMCRLISESDGARILIENIAVNNLLPTGQWCVYNASLGQFQGR